MLIKLILVNIIIYSKLRCTYFHPQNKKASVGQFPDIFFGIPYIFILMWLTFLLVNKTQLKTITDVLMDSWLIKYHLHNMGFTDDALCTFSGEVSKAT